MDKCALCGRKISILIITIYFISFFLFELFIGTARTLEYVEECVEQDMFNVLAPLVTHIEAGIWYLIEKVWHFFNF